MLYHFLNNSYKQAVTARLSGSDLDIAVPRGGRAEEFVNRAMFMLLGKVAKLDGRVTIEDIGYARLIMNLLDLGDSARHKAVDDFDQGKLRATDVSPILKKLVQHIGRRNELAYLFMKIQCQAACVYGGMGLPKKVFLRNEAEILSYNKIKFQEVCNESRKFCPSGAGSNWSSISEAYDVLQLAPGVNEEQIKRAYRRLVSQHHPDKLNTKGLSEEGLRSAQEQFTSIRSAYEILCGKRKIRA